jgi:hypothetical protein
LPLLLDRELPDFGLSRRSQNVSSSAALLTLTRPHITKKNTSKAALPLEYRWECMVDLRQNFTM